MSLEHIRAVIFDMDGLMFDTEPIYRLAWQQAAAEQGFTLSDDLYEPFVGRTTADAEALLASTFGPALALPAFRERWRVIWYNYVRSQGAACKPGLLELLSLLDRWRIPRAVATSSSWPETEVCLRDLAQHFMTVATVDDVRQGKPAPDLFLLAAERLQVDPANCLVLEDSAAGVRAADAAGMPVILVPDLQEPAAEIVAQAYRVYRTLHEVRALLAEHCVRPNPDW